MPSYKKLSPGVFPGIGGSQAAMILGQNKYKSALDFWEEYKGVVEPFDGNLATELGKATEQINMALYQRRTHNIVYSYPPEIDTDGGWFRRSPDGIIRSSDGEDRLIIFEAKSSFSFGATKLFPNESFPEDLPEHYEVQCQWYMSRDYDGIIAEETHLSALITTPNHKVYTIYRDGPRCEMMLEFIEDWWKKYIVGDIPPPKKQSDDAKDVLRKTSGNVVVLDEAKVDVINKFVESKDDLAKAKKRFDKSKAKVIHVIGDHDGVSGDWGRITNKVYDRSSLDQKLLLEQLTKEVGEKRAIEIIGSSKKTVTSRKFYTSFK